MVAGAHCVSNVGSSLLAHALFFIDAVCLASSLYLCDMTALRWPSQARQKICNCLGMQAPS